MDFRKQIAHPIVGCADDLQKRIRRGKAPLDHSRLQPLKIGGHWPNVFEQLRGLALCEVAAVHAA